MSFINPNKTMREMLIRNHKRSISHLLCFMNLHTGLSEGPKVKGYHRYIYIYYLYIYILLIYIYYLYIIYCLYIYISHLYIYISMCYCYCHVNGTMIINHGYMFLYPFFFRASHLFSMANNDSDAKARSLDA